MIKNQIKLTVKNHGYTVLCVSTYHKKCTVSVLRKDGKLVNFIVNKQKSTLIGPFLPSEWNNSRNEIALYTGDYDFLTFQFKELRNY